MGRASVDPLKRTMQETNDRKEDISIGEDNLTLKQLLRFSRVCEIHGARVHGNRQNFARALRKILNFHAFRRRAINRKRSASSAFLQNIWVDSPVTAHCK